ncbi:hypothetical protein MTR67_006837 [Solanum verrucosum]|uniref:Reverse transcriptase/retrotransposon-derived protein RNase H-like domain-containing protein n=1 Tax=Solanum verrucosum TaxID=315347 RepID=A0AAF0PYR1_SOLVR|nr:hypothetical protein MTR67_006837 [Solanum verrucosum]
MKGVMIFGKKGKLSPRYVGHYRILKKVGNVAYELELPVELAAVHLVFHISLLKKCVGDPTSIVASKSVAGKDSLTYEEYVEAATWEAEATMKAKSGGTRDTSQALDHQPSNGKARGGQVQVLNIQITLDLFSVRIQQLQRKFVVGYSKRAATLTYLLKKDVKWVWSVRYEEGFKKLKEAFASEQILKLPDFEFPFEVHTNTSDKVLGGLLGQEGHPAAFESQKLNDTKQRY